MVEVKLLSGWDSMHNEISTDDEVSIKLELLEVTQESLLLDLFFDSACVTKAQPFLSEVK